MNLYDIIDNDRTDKNTLHSYLDIYQTLFNNKKNTAKNILEIGIYRGGSIKLWSEFFINAKIYGIDIIDIDNIFEDVKNNVNITLWNYFVINLIPCGIDMNNIHTIWDDIKNKENIILYKGSDAYDYNFFNEKFLMKNF